MKIKNQLPHLYVIAAFFVIVLIYFLPLWQGKGLGSHDIVQYQGMAKEIQDNRAKYGEEPFWTNSMFGGMPNTMVSMEYYGNLIKPIHSFTTRIVAYPASLIFVSMICFYVLMLAFDVHFILAAIGAIGFAFGSFNFIGLVAGHNAKLACISYMPLVFAGLVYAYRKNLLIGCALLGVGIALQVVNNHIQITYYLAFICLAYVLVEFYNYLHQKLLPKFFKMSAALLVTAALGLGTHAGYFLAINEYGKYSIRGKMELKPMEENKEAVREDGLDRDYVFNYSCSISEPLMFLMADYMGGASMGSLSLNSETAKALKENGVDPQNIRQFIERVPLYFGDQPMVAGPFYIGAIICFLFLLGMIVMKDRIKWALFACSIFGVLLMYGKNFPTLNYLLFDYFPLYNKFRSVTMAVIIPQFCMSIVAVLGLKTLLEETDKKKITKSLFQAAGIMGGFILLIFIMANVGDYSNPSDKLNELPDWLLNAIESDRKSMRTGDALRSFMFIALAVGVIYTFIIGKINKSIAITATALLTLVDLWMIDKRYLNQDSFQKNIIKNYYAPNEADALLLRDTDPNFRVFNLDNPFNDARTSYFHKSIGGYSPAKLRRYQDLIERVMSVEQMTFIDGLKKGEVNTANTPVLNMLNTKYFLAGDDERGVIPNQNALGNAWFVNEVKKVNSPDEEIAALSGFNPSQTAFIDNSKFTVSKTQFDKDSIASIKLIAFKPYQLSYESNSNSDGFGVFSEIYYPKGWTATIDGKEVEIKRVNYVLRGLEIPAGKHTISFVMVNEAYTLGNNIGLICSILLYAGLIGAVVMVIRSKD
jgi:hypothetical protein